MKQDWRGALAQQSSVATLSGLASYLQVLLVFVSLAAVSCSTSGKTEEPSADVSFPDIELKRVAFGSCNKQLGREVQQKQVWRSASSFQPQLWLWTGDAVYSKNLTVSSLKNAFEVQANLGPYHDFLDGKGQGANEEKEARDMNHESNLPSPILVDGVWVRFSFYVCLLPTVCQDCCVNDSLIYRACPPFPVVCFFFLQRMITIWE
jgi:hypothetical protein